MKNYPDLALALVIGALASPAFAETRIGPVSLEAEVGVVSDYRFRGYSLSDDKAAVQAGLTASLDNGLYAYAWGSTIDEYGAGSDGKGATVELDYVVGWAGELGGLDVDLSAQIYSYPGGVDVDYLEIPVTVSKTAGDWRWTLGGAYAPSQSALGHEDNAYAWGGLAWEAESFPVQFALQAGYEDGAYAPGGKWDWSAGVSKALGPVTIGLSYSDSDKTSGGLIASIVASF